MEQNSDSQNRHIRALGWSVIKRKHIHVAQAEDRIFEMVSPSQESGQISLTVPTFQRATPSLLS